MQVVTAHRSGITLSVTGRFRSNELFDDIERTDYELAKYAEPQFVYLNRSMRVEIARIHDEPEEWFSHYPVAGQAELCERFRSVIDLQHQAASFELFLHELFLRLGCQGSLHFAIPTGAKTPDFLVESPNGDYFCTEATVATGESIEEANARRRENTVYDVLDRKVHSLDFFL